MNNRQKTLFDYTCQVDELGHGLFACISLMCYHCCQCHIKAFNLFIKLQIVK